MASVDELTRFICLFHDASRARTAVSALQNLGFARETLSTLGDHGNSNEKVSPQALSNLGVPDRDLGHLQEGLQRGGVLVSLEAPESRSDEIERIFHKYSADKIDEVDAQTEEAYVAPVAAPIASTPAAAVESDQMVIPIAQEELLVGKREVDRGGVRVFRRTVSEPVSEDVSLHSERVALEYREVNRAATDADLRAGSQEFELIETAEVPVVQKVARVVEEVHVGKEQSDHTEVIQDTVRHTEVDIENLDASSVRTGDPLKRDQNY